MMNDKQVLLVIDMQNGLLKRNVFNKQTLINNINDLITYFRKDNQQVIFFRHTNDSFSKINTIDWEISEELDKKSSDHIFNKTTSSVFKNKEFVSLLKELGIIKVVITGLVSNGCVQAACLDALKLGLLVNLISDGHSTFHQDQEDMVKYWNDELQKAGVKVISTKEFIKA